MNRKAVVSVLTAGMALLLLCSGLDAASLKTGYQAGNLKFAKPLTAADQKYLGLKKSGAFTPRDLPVKYLLIEILNVNCPHCTEQAAALNRLFRLVEGSELKDRLKFIGVVSNSEAAAQRWRTEYHVPFALVADPDWAIAGHFNITGTPTTVVVDQSGKVVVLHDGVFADAQAAFKQLKARLK